MNQVNERKLVALSLIMTGMGSVIVQTLFIRELIMVFFGNELCLGIIFACWLFWVAVGSWTMGRMASKFRDQIRVFILTLILVSLILPLELLGVRISKYLLHFPPGAMFGFSQMFYVSFVLLAPFCLITGFQFTLGCKIYNELTQNSPLAVGKVYIYEAIGSMLGGFLFSYILVTLLGSFEIIFWLSIVNLLAAIVLIFCYFKRQFSFFLFLAGILLLFNVGIKFSGGEDRLDKLSYSLSWKGFNLVEVATSKYNNFVVTETGSLYSLFENGSLFFTNPDKLHAEETVHLAMLEVPAPKRVLIIGGAVNGCLYELLKYPVEEIYYVELDPLLIKIAQKYIIPSDKQALVDPRVKIRVTDGRLFVKNYQGGKFDCVIINVGNPLTAELNRFYTVEFFREVSAILNRDGVVSLGIDSDENYLGAEMENFNRAIYNTVKEVFPNIVLSPGETLFLFASNLPAYLTGEVQVLKKRIKERGIKTETLLEYRLSDRFSPQRIKYILAILNKPGENRLNFDFYPISYYYNITLWGSRIKSTLARLLWKMEKVKFAWAESIIIVLIMSLFLVRKKVKKTFIPLSVMSAGLAGIVLELILIIGFQVLYGYLYQMIGIIVASFMLGVVIGTAYINRRLGTIKNRIMTLAVLQTLLAFYAFLIPLIFIALSLFGRGKLAPFSIQLLFPLLTVLAGIFIGLIFPLANKIYHKITGDIGQTAGSLYAFDLTGACLGSLFTVVLLIPVWGIHNTAIMVALINSGLAILLFSIRDETGTN